MSKDNTAAQSLLSVSQLQQTWQQTNQFLKYSWLRFVESECQSRAAALTFVTLFALVPMLAVIYSVFSIIPAFQQYGDQLQSFLLGHLMPDSGTELQDYLNNFSSQARNLTGWGIGLLGLSAYLMLRNIEKTFNRIWGIKQERKGLSSFLLYWAVLTLGPLLIGLGMSLAVLSFQRIVSDYQTLSWVQTLLKIAPWLLATTGFSMLYATVPNCKVPLKHALVGGLVTTIGFDLLKGLFAWVVVNSSFNAIYGAFAVVPLSLLWIYFIWSLVLGGAVLVQVLSSYRKHTELSQGSNQTLPDLYTAILILDQFLQAQKSGASLNFDHFKDNPIDLPQWQRICLLFEQHNLLASTEPNNYVLCRDLNNIRLHQLHTWLPCVSPASNNDIMLNQQQPWLVQLKQKLLELESQQRQTLELSLGELLATEP